MFFKSIWIYTWEVKVIYLPRQLMEILGEERELHMVLIEKVSDKVPRKVMW